MKIEIELPDELAPTIERIEQALGASVEVLIKRAVLAVVNVYKTRPLSLVQVYQVLEASDAGAYIIKAVKKRKDYAKPQSGEGVTYEI